MSDTVSNDAVGQAPAADAAAAAAAAGTDASAAAQPSTDVAEQQPSAELTPEQLKKQIDELRKENASHRTKLKEYEQRDLTEQQKAALHTQELEQENQTIKEKLREEARSHAVETAAMRHGIDHELANALIHPEFDENGQPVGVDEQVKALIAKHPNLISQPAAGASAANPNRGAVSQGIFTEEQIADRAFYVANRAAITQAYREGRIVKS